MFFLGRVLLPAEMELDLILSPVPKKSPDTLYLSTSHLQKEQLPPFGTLWVMIFVFIPVHLVMNILQLNQHFFWRHHEKWFSWFAAACREALVAFMTVVLQISGVSEDSEKHGGSSLEGREASDLCG